MKKDILTRPFAPEQLRSRPGRNGKTLSYVETHAVIARLNEGCDAWSFEIVSHEVQDGQAIVVGKLTADGVVKMAFGGSEVTLDKAGRVVSLADDMKAAASDALKKAASLLGVGLELYGAQVPQHAPQQPVQAPRDAPANGNGQQEPAAPEPGDRITSRQLAAVYGACRRNGVTREQLEDLVDGKFGKARVEQLSKREASFLIDEIGAMPGRGNGAHA